MTETKISFRSIMRLALKNFEACGQWIARYIVLCVIAVLPVAGAGPRAEQFDADAFVQDVRDLRLLLGGGRALSTTHPTIWSHPKSPWLPYLGEQMTQSMRADAVRNVRRAAAAGMCEAVAGLEWAAFRRRYPELVPALEKPDMARLFKKTIYPSFSHSFARCHALKIIEPLFHEARRVSAARGEVFTVHEVQYLIEMEFETTARTLELDQERLNIAVAVLEHLSGCEHDRDALADLLRFEPFLRVLMSAADRGHYLVRLAAFLDAGDTSGYQPVMGHWDALDRSRVERIEHAFSHLPFADAVATLPYRSDSCQVLAFTIAQMFQPDLGHREAFRPRIPSADQSGAR